MFYTSLLKFYKSLLLILFIYLRAGAGLSVYNGGVEAVEYNRAEHEATDDFAY